MLKILTAESQRNMQQMNRKQKNKPEKLNSKHVCQYESSKFVNWTEQKCDIDISPSKVFLNQNEEDNKNCTNNNSCLS